MWYLRIVVESGGESLTCLMVPRLATYMSKDAVPRATTVCRRIDVRETIRAFPSQIDTVTCSRVIASAEVLRT